MKGILLTEVSIHYKVLLLAFSFHGFNTVSSLSLFHNAGTTSSNEFVDPDVEVL